KITPNQLLRHIGYNLHLRLLSQPALFMINIRIPQSRAKLSNLTDESRKTNKLIQKQTIRKAPLPLDKCRKAPSGICFFLLKKNTAERSLRSSGVNETITKFTLMELFILKG
ncbi:MAG: hypothetical protein RBT43_04645, partial [bacterium]|nr:hypothetical protein [bacterium]